MELYLVRHGTPKAESEDPRRGLTEEGKQIVERMADFLAGLRIPLHRIDHSEKLRARQTAEIMAVRLQPAEGTREVSGLAPNDDVEPIGYELERESKNRMLVGHLPFLSLLVSRLLEVSTNKLVVDFETAGVVRLDRFGGGQWAIRWVMTPELLPKLKR